jgi:aromatic ring-opening dioxygenase LigB subunit
MLSYTAHIPHSPLLLPQISKQAFSKFKKIHDSIQEINHDIYSKNCDTVILLTPHISNQKNAHILHINPLHKVDLVNFGNFNTQEQFSGDTNIAYYIRSKLYSEYPISTITNPSVDIGSATAMMHLQIENKKYNFLPIMHANTSLKSLYSFGSNLRDILEQAHNKIAVISLGDLCRTKKSTQKEGSQIDKSLLDSLYDQDTDLFMNHSSRDMNSFAIAAIKPLAIVLGMLKNINYTADITRYEQNHGIGFATIRFV